MKMLQLEECCEILDSMRVPITAKDRKKGPYPYYGANGVQDYVADYIFDDDLVLLAEDGGNFGSDKRPIAYKVSGKCWVNNHAHVLKPKAGMNVDYLCYSLMFYKVDGMVNGATRMKLTQAAMRRMLIPSRTIEGQKAVVRLLNRIQMLIKVEKEQLKKYDELIKSRFVEMFGDPVTNPLNWEEHCLDEYVEFLTSGSRGWTQYFVDEENELFITIKNVKNNHISLNKIQYINAPDSKEAERTKVKKGDLLISITADLGRTGVVDEEIADKGAYINQHLSLVRLDKKKVNPLYISHFLETEGGKRQFKSKNQNSVKAGLNFDAIKSLKILVPPLEWQNEYLNFVHQIDKLRFVTQKSLAETQQLFDSLMQKYFG